MARERLRALQKPEYRETGGAAAAAAAAAGDDKHAQLDALTPSAPKFAGRWAPPPPSSSVSNTSVATTLSGKLKQAKAAVSETAAALDEEVAGMAAKAEKKMNKAEKASSVFPLL